MPYVAGQKLRASDLMGLAYTAEYNAASNQVIGGTGAPVIVAFGTINLTSALVTRNTSGAGHSFTLNKSGVWAITTSCRYIGSTGGQRYFAIVGPTGRLATAGVEPGAEAVTINLGATRYLTAGTVIEVSTANNAGSNRTLEASNTECWGRIDLCWLGG